MARELAIALYLLYFRVIFMICKNFPQRAKTTFVASFGENVLSTLEELEKQTDQQVVILKTSHCSTDFQKDGRIVQNFSLNHMLDWLRSIYHLATSKTVIADNYYGFLAVTNFKPNVNCVQLWHAAGAIKRFGLADPSIQNRSRSAHKRFYKVYHRFNHVIVGSDRMASIFKQSFDVSEEQILRTGIPRTDFFFDEPSKSQAFNSLMAEYPIMHDKKVILYAPTYRDDTLNGQDVQLDIDEMYHELKHDYVLLLHLHPAVNDTFENRHPGFVINVSGNHSLNHLLLVTDILITDYSSIPFEFSLLKRPMVFFAYDLDQYTEERGFWRPYNELVPGPVVTNTKDLVDVIYREKFDIARIESFANEWNQYSNGSSSEQVIKAIYKEDQTQVKKPDLTRDAE